jgi:hypothetical protein
LEKDMSIFLTPEEVAELTGIRRGCKGKSREQRQATALKSMGVPHYINAAKRPIVARAAIEGAATAIAKSNAPTVEAWEPVMH